MRKYISIIVVVIAALLALIFGSCSSDDNDKYEVSEEWKVYQASVVTKVVDALIEGTSEKMYTPLASQSGLGRIYYKSSDYITKNQTGNFDEEGPSAFASKAARPIYESDVLLVRCERWYYYLDGKKKIYKSTEINIYTGESQNNNGYETFAINSSAKADGVVDGLKTLLLDMEVGEERIACIPYIMGYGILGADATAVSYSVLGYTTLFFDIKILKNLTEEAELNK